MTVLTEDLIAELEIPADLGEIRRASVWLESVGEALNVPAEHILRLDLCLNEALANIINYGGLDPQSPQIQIGLTCRADAINVEAVLTLVDAGMPFDPLAYQPKPRPLTLAETEPGGLGIMMMRDAADGMTYSYSGKRNVLSFAVRWPLSP